MGTVGFSPPPVPPPFSISTEHQWRSQPTDCQKDTISTNPVGGISLDCQLRKRLSLKRWEIHRHLMISGWRVPWQEGIPITPSEKRWLELYQKHQRAWRALVAAVAAPGKT